MMKCASCMSEVPNDSRFCLSCGARINSTSPTLSVTAAAAAPAAARKSQDAQAKSRFLPGTILADRYRIVAEVGRGGMGEVYRADDLRLGQAVALKFLPEPLTRDSAALARLNREVRMARQVSHPKVCRVFDVGETDGVPFISMEFVDGEDIGSLLQRIGRLPQDKALQVAHQLCAGVAEAHAFGVLHRDLKPANIMLDGRGNVRITDFGLAATAEELSTEHARAGTPAYMAPEQLQGERATTQTDLYALGLVLYELFSGKEAYPGTTIADMLAQRQKGAPVKLSSVVKGIDPAIERIIFQCLDRDPHNRPRSALVVAAALPGGDPLAAAIAAGETPSPEMVAAATDEPLVSVGALWAMLAAIVFATAIYVFLVQNGTVLGLAPPVKTPEAMAEHAQQLLQRLGYSADATDRAYWYAIDRAQVSYQFNGRRTPEAARQLRSSVPVPTRFIYRQSQQKLWAYARIGRLEVSATNPPDIAAGMLTLTLDGAARLLEFSAVPPLIEHAPAIVSAPDWRPFIAEAGLKETDLVPTSPKWLPQRKFDSYTAWNAQLGGHPVHIIAAAYRGAPVYFKVTFPWMTSASDSNPKYSSAWVRVSLTVYAVFTVLLLLAALVLARRNLRLGRGDRRGATRIATVIFIASFTPWIFHNRHIAEMAELDSYWSAIGDALYSVAFIYLAYLAIEPYVRRRWPNVLVSWTRVLAGRYRDSRVGRDLLAGCLAGVIICVIELLPNAVTAWIHVPGGSAGYVPPYSLRGVISTFAWLAYAVKFGLIYSLGYAVWLLVLRLLVRRLWVALALFVVSAAAVMPRVWAVNAPVSVALSLVIYAAAVWVMFRFGLLGLAAMFFIEYLLPKILLTFDPLHWYFWPSAIALLAVALVVIYAFRTGLGGRPVFGWRMLED